MDLGVGWAMGVGWMSFWCAWNAARTGTRCASNCLHVAIDMGIHIFNYSLHWLRGKIK